MLESITKYLDDQVKKDWDDSPYSQYVADKGWVSCDSFPNDIISDPSSKQVLKLAGDTDKFLVTVVRGESGWEGITAYTLREEIGYRYIFLPLEAAHRAIQEQVAVGKVDFTKASDWLRYYTGQRYYAALIKAGIPVVLRRHDSWLRLVFAPEESET